MLQLGEEKELANEAYIANRMVQLIQQITSRQAAGKPVLRFNQAKTLGVLNAEFEVLPDLPPTLAHGLFALPGRYEAQLRLASASTFDDRKKDLRGASIKVHGVPGEKLLGKSDQQDFLLNSYPVLFARDPESFLKFIEATLEKKRLQYFFNVKDAHLLAKQILLMARERPSSPFDIPFWSTTPYRLGDNPYVAVKYKLTPCSDYQSPKPWLPTKNYLRARMKDHLSKAPVCFEFGVQFQLDPEEMPIENASKIWLESESPFHTVARVWIHDQDFQSEAVQSIDDHLSFNPWQSLAAHRPLGGINRVRLKVYQEMAQFRVAHS